MDTNKRKFLIMTMIDAKSYAEVAEELKVDRKEFSKWWEELKPQREQIAKVRTIWRRKFPNKEINYEAFEQWYINQQKECYYCNTTQEEIDQLIARFPNLSKRLVTRGKSLEIERLEPNEKYANIDNLRLACYWCNNAKSDVFTAEEFKPIGIEIGKVLRNKLSNG